MKPVLSVSMLLSSTSLSCRILYMDESLRKADLAFCYTASNGYQIKSHTHPEINDNSFYLRGSWRQCDDNHFIAYPYRHTVSDLYEKVLRALKDFLVYEFGHEFVVFIDNCTVSFFEFAGYDQLFSKE